MESTTKLYSLNYTNANTYLFAFVFIVGNVWGIERSGFFNGREKWAKGFENQRV